MSWNRDFFNEVAEVDYLVIKCLCAPFAWFVVGTGRMEPVLEDIISHPEGKVTITQGGVISGERRDCRALSLCASENDSQ